MANKVDYRTDRYLCTIKNDSLGKITIATLRRSGLKFRIRGRHSDRKGLFKMLKPLGIYPNYCNDVPTKYATSWALYLVDHKCSACDYLKNLKSW